MPAVDRKIYLGPRFRLKERGNEIRLDVSYEDAWGRRFSRTFTYNKDSREAAHALALFKAIESANLPKNKSADIFMNNHHEKRFSEIEEKIGDAKPTVENLLPHYSALVSYLLARRQEQ